MVLLWCFSVRCSRDRHGTIVTTNIGRGGQVGVVHLASCDDCYGGLPADFACGNFSVPRVEPESYFTITVGSGVVVVAWPRPD